jgi:hypothetical protein
MNFRPPTSEADLISVVDAHPNMRDGSAELAARVRFQDIRDGQPFFAR